VGVPSHVRWIVETSQAARGTKGQMLSRYQLMVRQKSNADDEVFDSNEARLYALAPHRGQRHPRLHSQIPRSTDRPRISAHCLDERLQLTQRRLGVENELGDAIATRSLDQAEQCVTPARREDVNTRLGREIEPLRVDWSAARKQAQGRAADQWLQPTRLDGCERVGQIDDDDVTRPHFLCGWGGSPMSRVDLRCEGAAHGGAGAVDRTEQMHSG
jgi:hypothetical protein